MIKTLKCATNMPEMLFLCREYGILPVLTESIYLGMTLARALYQQYPESKLALFDSNTLLEVVSYDDEAELLPYMKQKQFDYGYKIDQDGQGIPIEELGNKNNITCSNCGCFFDWVKEPEVKMGYVKCPKCGFIVDQEGKAYECQQDTQTQ